MNFPPLKVYSDFGVDLKFFGFTPDYFEYYASLKVDSAKDRVTQAIYSD